MAHDDWPPITPTEGNTMEDLPALDLLHLHEIAYLVRADWRKPDGTPNVWFGAVPYLQAMLTLGSIDDDYGLDSGREIVAYFLANAAQWRGPVARTVKAELKRRLA